MQVEQVISGIFKYLNEEVYKGMTDWQEVLARIAVSRTLGNVEGIKALLNNNSYVKTFAIIDHNGNVDVDGLIRDIRTQIEAKGKLTFTLPMFGSFTFTVDDVDKLHRAIHEAEVTQ